MRKLVLLGVERGAVLHMDVAAEGQPGLQQFAITDLDGTLLGHPGQVCLADACCLSHVFTHNPCNRLAACLLVS